jgi:hypothetical protein
MIVERIEERSRERSDLFKSIFFFGLIYYLPLFALSIFFDILSFTVQMRIVSEFVVPNTNIWEHE